MTQSNFSWEEPPARASQSLDAEAAFVTTALSWPSNILSWLTASAPGGWRGRTSPVHSPPATETMRKQDPGKISQLSFLPSADGPSKSQKAGGRTVEWSFPGLSMAPTGWRGESLTLSSAEHASSLGPSHNDGAVCSLSDILETGDHLRPYFLSPRACLGILRRAAKRGKELPGMLLRALQAVAGAWHAPAKLEDKIPSLPSTTSPTP